MTSVDDGSTVSARKEWSPGQTLPPEFFNNPGDDIHGWDNEVRSHCPVHKINHPPGAEAYVVADYETALSAFGDPRLSKQLTASPDWFQEQLKDASPILVHHMLNADPPDHTRLRKLVSKAFTARRMEMMRPKIQQITDDLIDGFPESGEVDLMAFAFDLPMNVISEFLAIPPTDRGQVKSDVVLLSNAPYPDEERNRLLKAASDKVEEYLVGLLANRREDLGDDLVSVLIRAADEDEVYSEEELISNLVLLIIAGHKTTAHLIGNGMSALLARPDQLALLKSDPSLVESAVEEFLRFESPVFRGTLRISTEDMELAGVKIPKQSFVHVLLGAANHDPAVFDNPGELDITRQANRHLSFGHGPHFCAGAPLSRVEGSIAFPTLLRRLSGLRLAAAPSELEWAFDNSTSRGLRSLPVRYDALLPRE
ncbi:cytochrome P450 [Micromonospora sp. ALFpr18c]|uniref:cytochrome P450 family protein n=1 Tax=unclassified Micromonospora TaxID=2617518 RepID=UPI00124B3C8E|nr:cytochrome P450 [Micromonospora sp. ALFpr18c]KAB1933410.1 cytochrome P450 [Micromonospora sp. ALFpr18c]